MRACAIVALLVMVAAPAQAQGTTANPVSADIDTAFSCRCARLLSCLTLNSR